MSEIIEKVANAFGSVTWQENKTVGDYRNEVARAAIKATLEHLRDNVSEEMVGVAYDVAVDNGDYVDAGEFTLTMNSEVLKAAFSQALTELEEI